MSTTDDEEKPARNVIIFVGDGMGMSTITASRIYKGQKNNGVAGEEQELVFETFPNVGLSKVIRFATPIAAERRWAPK